MRCLFSLSLVALLSVANGSLSVTPLPRVSDPGKDLCKQSPDAVIPPPLTTTHAEKTSIPATVTAIDPVHGVLNLATNIGSVQVEASPQMLQDLQVGDYLELCTVDEKPSENLLQDSTVT